MSHHLAGVNEHPAVGAVLRRYEDLHPLPECAARALGPGAVAVGREGAPRLRASLNKGQRLPAAAGGAAIACSIRWPHLRRPGAANP
jgi:hypothetical protein